MTSEPAEDFQLLEGVTALPPDEGSGGLGRLAPEIGERLRRESVLDDAEAFRRSGWSFAPSSEGRGLPVYRSASGRLVIVGNQLNVKFTPDLTPAEIDSLLETHHLRRHRSLGFAKNLLTVAQDEREGGDPVAVSKRLSLHPSVEFAEPVVLETIEGRRVGGGVADQA